jgi:hypothetical protein
MEPNHGGTLAPAASPGTRPWGSVGGKAITSQPRSAGGLLAGRLPPRVLALIVEWASLHQAELLANWDRCRRMEPPVRIPPLE